MGELFVIVLLWLGGIFMFISAVGIVRMPDLFTRMHAAAKLSTIGIGSLIGAVAIWFPQLEVSVPAMLIVVFYFITSPVAAHMIGRASYYRGVPLWEKTVCDEYARERHQPDPESDAILYSLSDTIDPANPPKS